MHMGFPANTVGLPAFAADFSNERNYSIVVQRVQIAHSAGSILLSSVPGILYDYTGTCLFAYIGGAGLYAIASALLIIAYKKRNHSISN